MHGTGDDPWPLCPLILRREKEVPECKSSPKILEDHTLPSRNDCTTLCVLTIKDHSSLVQKRLRPKTCDRSCKVPVSTPNYMGMIYLFSKQNDFWTISIVGPKSPRLDNTKDELLGPYRTPSSTTDTLSIFTLFSYTPPLGCVVLSQSGVRFTGGQRRETVDKYHV